MSTSPTLHFVLRVIHLLAVAVWVGSSLGAAGDIRRTLRLGSPHTEALIPRIRRSSRVTIAAGVLTAVSGIVLIFAAGGFRAVPPRIHIGLTFTLVTFIVGAVLAHPAWLRIVETIESKADLAPAIKALGRFSMAAGLEHLLKLTVLCLMAWKP